MHAYGQHLAQIREARTHARMLARTHTRTYLHEHASQVTAALQQFSNANHLRLALKAVAPLHPAHTSLSGELRGSGDLAKVKLREAIAEACVADVGDEEGEEGQEGQEGEESEAGEADGGRPGCRMGM